MIRRWCRGWGLHEADAEDVTQEILFGVARAIERHRPELLYGQVNNSIPLLLESGAGAVLAADLHGDPASEKLEEDWKPLPRRLLSFASRRLEDRRWLPRLDGFTTASHGLARRLAPLGKPTSVIWGGVDPELFTAPPPAFGSRVTVGYAGNFRPYQASACCSRR